MRTQLRKHFVGYALISLCASVVLLGFTPPASAAVPTAPTGVTATAANTSIEVTWTAVTASPSISSYTAAAYSASTGGSSQGNCISSSTACTISSLTNGTPSYIEVTATNTDGTSTASTPRVSATPIGISSIPRNINIVGEDSALNVSWLAPSDTGSSAITSYTVDVYLAASGGSSVAGCTTTDGNTLRCTVNTLTNGTRYYISVYATNASGNSHSTPREGAVVGALPSAPRSVDTDRANGSMTVAWLPPATNGGNAITGYTVRAYTSLSSQAGVTDSCTTTELSCTLRAITNETNYYVSVTATSAVGEGSPSSRVSAPGFGAPSAPQSVRVERGNGFVRVTWQSPASNGGSAIQRYYARAFPTISGGESVATCIPLPTNPTQCNLGPLANGTTYFIDVNAENRLMSGVASDPRIPVIPATQPSPPREVTAREEGSGVKVSWKVPATDGGFPIKSYTATAWSSLISGEKVGTCSTSGDSCIIKGLDGAPVFVDVNALNEIGTGTTSIPRTKLLLTGVPSPPLSVVSVLTPKGVLVSWLPSSDDQGSPITSYLARASDLSGKEAGICTAVPKSAVLRHGETAHRMACHIYGLNHSQKYVITVGAVNGISTTYAAAVPLGFKLGAPTMPRELVATPGEKSIFAQATLSAINLGATKSSYTFQAWTAATGGDLVKKCTVQTTVGDIYPGCTLTGLANYQTYWVDAFTSNTNGSSRPTPRVEIKPMASTPTQPRNFRVTVNSSGFTAQWATPSFDGGYPIKSYLVRVSTTQAGLGSISAPLSGSTPSPTPTATPRPTASSTSGFTSGGNSLATTGYQCTAIAPKTTCTVSGIPAGTHVWIDVIAQNPVGDGKPSITLDRNIPS